MDYLSALTIGLVGSLHCVGMCGPIALAIPLTTPERNQVIFQSFLYHMGRITTYALLGLVMGLMGWGIALAGYQKGLSIGFGVMLILVAVFSISIEQRMMQNGIVKKGFNAIKTKLAQLLSITNRSSAFSIGLLNGILPCGLVYLALAGAVVNGQLLGGALYMFLFGVGTLPLMIGVMAFGKLGGRYLPRFRKIIPYALVLFGCLLIYRGLMLEIPISLDLWEANNFEVRCH